jgi:Flp pilus assembly protein TadG
VLARSFPKEVGSAAIETMFALLICLVLVLGTIEVALALYARNVVLSAAHEGARAAVEVGSDPGTASMAAHQTVRRAAGRLIRELNIEVSIRELPERAALVRLSATVVPPGPLPFPFSVDTVGRASQGAPPR